MDSIDQNFLQMCNLSKSYLEGDQVRLVLSGASASIKRGEFVAILGKSGSGKSTLLNLISGIDLVDEGEIWLENHNLTAMTDQQRTLFRRNHTGFIFQFFNLIPTLTVWENATLALELTGRITSDGVKQAEELLHEVGLIDRRKTYPDRLSGGEQQRVAIARALIHDPLIVLADEPTGNLDEETSHQVLELLDRLTRKAGKNLIMVTHNQEAARYADRVFILRDGKLMEK